MDSSNKKDYHIFSAFWLKIIAMVSMVLDHIGVVYEYNYAKIANYDVTITMDLRILGRLAFVLFAFISVESILHTKRPLKYLAQLLILSIVCDIGYLIAFHEYTGNPIMTLFLSTSFIYLLNNKKWYFKLCSLIPLGISLLTAFEILPLKADYCIYGICTYFIFYLSHIIGNYIRNWVCVNYSLDEESFKGSSFDLTLHNGIAVSLFVTFSLIIYFLNPIWNGHGFFTDMNSTQIYAIFGLIPIIFYNGKRGYNKNWFKYGSYVFFPLHILVIYFIFYLILL